MISERSPSDLKVKPRDYRRHTYPVSPTIGHSLPAIDAHHPPALLLESAGDVRALRQGYETSSMLHREASIQGGVRPHGFRPKPCDPEMIWGFRAGIYAFDSVRLRKRVLENIKGGYSKGKQVQLLSFLPPPPQLAPYPHGTPVWSPSSTPLPHSPLDKTWVPTYETSWT
ncbi:hypothetical protein BV25DRAFT_633158 [Artomyces pyxidatus]|uniref:Uncharacterized protein n=1 Tax=Artomyces pyxidatus TaxID=48021 RepID=A0ACB8T176_9AGAM|nr:hypothetical protein BV25DRAFT_633158 [Artomyces pyxidatus]